MIPAGTYTLKQEIVKVEGYLRHPDEKMKVSKKFNDILDNYKKDHPDREVVFFQYIKGDLSEHLFMIAYREVQNEK